MSTFNKKYKLNEEGKNFIHKNYFRKHDIKILDNNVWSIFYCDYNIFHVYSDNLHLILDVAFNMDNAAFKCFIELTPEELSIIDILL